MILVFRATACVRGTAKAVTPMHAGIAQLVEQRIRNAKVVGSTPIAGTRDSRKAPANTYLQGLFSGRYPINGLYAKNRGSEHSSNTVNYAVPTALSQDSQAVILKISKSIRST